MPLFSALVFYQKPFTRVTKSDIIIIGLKWPYVNAFERRITPMKNEYKFIGRVNSPDELKGLDKSEILPLCDEIRDCIIATTEKNGGHLASNLGVVEITVAIHRVFDCPRDHIIFDVGHQSYTHKLLTGRYNGFDTLRQSGGISGFTNREESEYDCFGAGHSSTSLSAALGFAEADKILGADAYTVVVLGDGAFTGGMIHEALNNCNKELKKLIIILNENEMSISKNIGRFASSIARIRKRSGYLKAKRFTVSFVKKIPLIGGGLFKAIRGVKKAIKNSLYGSNYFEDMGLYYLGPADGNDYESVEELLRAAKRAGENVLIHLKTQKGKGFKPAEEYPDIYHGVSPTKKEGKTSSFSLELGQALCALADKDERVCAITAAMSSGTGIDSFAEKHADRFFDVGIAEEHAVTFASALAANGMKPVFAVYSTFLQRGYDQIIHDAALQKLPITLAIDRAGFNEADGATHHGIFDVAFLSHVPGVKIYTPVTYKGLARSLEIAVNGDSVSAIRYPSGSENSEVVKAFYGNDGGDVIGIKTDFDTNNTPENIIITHGRIAGECLKAEAILKDSGIDCGVMLCEYIAPYSDLADEIYSKIKGSRVKAITFVEEEIRAGGFGMLLSDAMKNKGYLDGIEYTAMAADDAFVRREKGQTYWCASGLDSKRIAEKIKEKNN